MSTEPTGWTEPKTDYVKTDTFIHTDINVINENIEAIENGNRTLYPQQPSGNTGPLWLLFDWIAYQIAKLKGTETWYDADNWNLHSHFWLDSTINVSLESGDLVYIAKGFTTIPNNKRLILRKLMYYTQNIIPLNDPNSHRFKIEGWWLYPEYEVLLFEFWIDRPTDPNEPYWGDSIQNIVLHTNSTGSPQDVEIRLKFGGASQQCIIGTIFKAKFDQVKV